MTREGGSRLVRWGLAMASLAAVLWTAVAREPLAPRRNIKRPTNEGVGIVHTGLPNWARLAAANVVERRPGTLVEQAFGGPRRRPIDDSWREQRSISTWVPLVVGEPSKARPNASFWLQAPTLPPGWERP